MDEGFIKLEFRAGLTIVGAEDGEEMQSGQNETTKVIK